MARPGAPLGLLLAGLVALGCAFSAGVPDRTPPRAAPVFARVSLASRSGFRVLLAGMCGTGSGTRAWVAADPVEFVVLWRDVGVLSPPPEVDFSEDVVFGLSRDGGACNPRVTGLTVSESGVVTIEHERLDPFQNCILLATRVAEVVVVPRRFLPSPVVDVWGFRFTVDAAPPG